MAGAIASKVKTFVDQAVERDAALGMSGGAKENCRNRNG